MVIHSDHNPVYHYQHLLPAIPDATIPDNKQHTDLISNNKNDAKKKELTRQQAQPHRYQTDTENDYKTYNKKRNVIVSESKITGLIIDIFA